MSTSDEHVRVLATGWYGAGNVGDELILRILARWCEEAGARVTTLSPFPRHTRSIHGLEAVDAFDFSAAAESMLDADLFVLGGGGLFQTHHGFTVPGLFDYAPGDISAYARPALMAHQMGVPTLLWAQGVGPLNGDHPREIVRDVFSKASFASVRDEVSNRTLREIGVGHDVLVAPDPVWAFPVDRSGQRSIGATRRLGLVLREWSFQPGWEDAFVAAIRSAASPQNERLVWIPFQVGEEGASSADMVLVRSLMARLGEYEHEVAASPDPDDMVAVLAGCDRLVCMRLHAQILALKLGRPALCIEYDPKMSRVSEMSGLPESLRLMPSAPPEAWRNGMRTLLETDRPLVSMERIFELEAAALAHKVLLHSAIDSVRGRESSRRWSSDRFDWVGTWSDSTAQRAFARREAALVAQLARSEGQVTALAGAMRQHELAVSTAERAVALSEGMVAAKEAELTALRAQVATGAERLHALQADVDACRADVAGLREELDRKDRQQLALRQEREAYSSECLELRKEIESRITVTNALMSEVSQLRADHDVAGRERDRMQGLLAERSAELDKVVGSWTWRLTHPIRLGRALLVLPAHERRALAYSAMRSAFWAMPQPLRLKLDSLRHRFVQRAKVAEEVELPASDAGLDWIALVDAAGKVAIVPSAFEFEELANQRPINLAKYLAGRGYTVLFAAWQWSRDERLSKSNQQVHPGIWQIDLYSLIDNVGKLARRQDPSSIYVLTLPAPELVNLHQAVRRSGFAVVYDILDEWEAFNAVGQAPWYSKAHEHEAVMAADVVAAVSPPLTAKFGHLRGDMHVIGNGYTPAVLGLDNKFCAAGARNDGKQLRIGYFGHLTDAWFDWGLVLDAARQLPDCRFEIIGYGEPQWVRDAASQVPNLTLLGKVPPSDLWKHARHWHAGLAPFRPGPLAVAIDPIKVYEYIYLGLPTVCTGIPHLADLPGVSVVEGLGAFVEACQAQLEIQPDYEAMERCLEQTTWEARFDSMLRLVDADGLRGMYGS